MLSQICSRLRTQSNFLSIYLANISDCKRFKTTLDYSRFPKLNEAELEETFTRGSGPGGQAVNKTSNCVLLRHIPTNILVKCHTHRIASRNREEARRLLLEKLDAHYNGELSIAAQQKAIDTRKSNEKKRRQQKTLEMKRSWQEREQSENCKNKKEKDQS